MGRRSENKLLTTSWQNTVLVVLAFTLAIFVSALAATNASAKTTQDTENPAVEAAKMKAKNAEFDHAVALMEKYIYIKKNGQLGLDNATLALELRKGGARAVDPTVFRQLKIAMAQTNRKIRAGELQASDVFPSPSVDIAESNPAQNGELSTLSVPSRMVWVI